jgi:hypothetical protein
MKRRERSEISDQRSKTPVSAEETLRLLARLPAPEGIEERVQAGLRAAATTAATKARILRWPAALQFSNLWQSSLVRVGAAAAIVAVVVGGGWVVSSRFQPAQSSSAIMVPPHASAQGGFSSAGAMRTPQTLNGPVVEAPASVRPAAQHASKPHHRGKPAAAKNPLAQPLR